MNKPIRILHVIRLMNHGGVESMIMNLYRNIDRTKVQFDFVQNSNEPAVYDEEILALGGRIYHCPRYNGKNHFAYVNWWKNFFEDHHKDYCIIHGHLGGTAAIYLSVAQKYGGYAIAHSHSTGGTLLYRLFSFPVRFIADAFFACSQDAGKSFFGNKWSEDECCCVLKNAIDAKRFVYNVKVRNDMRSELSISDDALVIGHVGQFRKEKNHTFLLDIISNLKNTNAVLLLVGDGPLRPQIEAEIAAKDLADKVILTGSQNDVWKYYQAMDVFVMPSHYEGLPVSMVEAQTADLPCLVSTNVPRESAITDLVHFEALDSGADTWAKQIVKLSNHARTSKLEEIKKAGFDIETTAEWLTEYYINVVKKHGK